MMKTNKPIQDTEEFKLGYERCKDYIKGLIDKCEQVVLFKNTKMVSVRELKKGIDG